MHLAILRLVLFIAGPVVLFFITPESLAALPDVCVWKAILGIDCWGCGMTRAFLAVLHADFARAVAYNPRVIVAFPLIAALAARSIWRDARTLFRAAHRSDTQLA